MKLVEDYKVAHPELAAEVTAILEGRDVVEIKPEDFRFTKMASHKQLVTHHKMPQRSG